VAASGRGQADTSSASVLQLYAWAWELLAGSRWRIVGAAALSLFTIQVVQFNAALLVHAVALLQGSNGAAAGGSQDILGLMPADFPTTALLFGIIALGLFGLQFIDRTVTLAIDTAVIYGMQEKLHRKMLRLGTRFHARNNIGALQMLFTRYVSQSAGILRELLVFPVVNGIALVTASIYLWKNLAPIIGAGNVLLLSCMLAAVIGLPILAWRVSLAMRAAIRGSVAADAALGDELVNSLRRPLDLQLLGAQQLRNAAFEARTRNAFAARMRSLRRSELANQIQRGMPQLLQAGILLFAVTQFLHPVAAGEQLAVGAAIVAVLQFVPMIVAPIQQTISFYNAAAATVPPVVELVGVLHAEEEVSEARHATALHLTNGTVSVRDVQVDGPDGANPILRAVTQEFEGGRVWGMIGRSGCGKSTLLATIARAADPSRGEVCIDGTDLRRVELASLRRSVAFLGQFPAFIDDTVRANLNLAVTPAGDEVLIKACETTGLLPRLRELAAPASPLDLTIFAEPNKGALSGGERRLLALARVLAHPARIVLLDEPTAGVDAAMRGRVAALIKALPVGTTVIVVDHDLEFIAEIADAVVCMDQGTVVTSVPRADLLDKPSPFLELWRAQQRWGGEAMAITTYPAPFS
jgi:ABC-type multidrug transport system fused ATPase/permease subunit